LRVKCPWDRKQTNESLRPNTIEETYELCDALMRDNQFVAELVANILDVEISCFRADLGIESDVQQDISQLPQADK